MKQGLVEGANETSGRAVSGALSLRWSRIILGLWLLFTVLVLAAVYAQVARTVRGDVSSLNMMREVLASTRFILLFWLACLALFLAIATGLAGRFLHSGKKIWIPILLVGLAVVAILYRVAPHFGEAAARALQGLLGAGLVLTAAREAGRLLAQACAWDWDNRREELLYKIGIGLGLLAYLSYGLALLNLYHPVAIQAVVLLLVLSTVVQLGLRIYRRGRSDVGQGAGARRLPAAEGRVWQGIVAAAALVTLVGALAPEIEYDSLWYHLWLPGLWLAQGHPVDIVKEYISLYPLTWELVYGAGMAFGGVVAAKLINWVAFLLAGLLVYEFTRRFFPRASAWLAVALFITVPTLQWEASSAYNDLGLALFAGLGIYALLRYAQSRSRQWFILAALSLGLALAVKHLALLVLAPALVLLASWLWRRDHALWPSLRSAALLGLAALLIPLPWYLRTYLASGNPLFPEMFKLFGAFPPDRWTVVTESQLDHFKAIFGYPRTVWNLARLPWLVTATPERFGGSLGPLFLLLLPALLIARRGSRLTGWLAGFCVLFAALWATPFSSFQLRFLVPLIPLLAVLAAEGFSRLQQITQTAVSKGASVFLVGMIALLLVLNFPAFLPLQEPNRDGWNGWLTHVLREVPVRVVVGLETQDAYLTRTIRSYAAWQYINASLPADALVLTFSGGDNLYSQRERISADATMAQPATWGAAPGSEAQALTVLHHLGVSYVLIDQRQIERGDLREIAIVQPSFQAACYHQEYSDGAFLLFRLTC